MALDDLGWNESLAEAFAATACADHRPGRIVRLDGCRATVRTAVGDEHLDLPGRLRKGAAALVVGDWVALGDAQSPGVAAWRLLPRQSHLARRAAGRVVRRQLLAANVDIVFIVSSMDADFSARRMERYLTIVHDGGACPVVLLTKAGLAEDPQAFLDQADAVAPGVDVHAIDVLAGIGIDIPAQYLARGRTAVLVGSSGVGKSTLLNHLAGETLMATHAVRAHDGQGQHTTTHRELFALPGGGIVIDTPGLRELALWADATSLGQTFPDIQALAQTCRFGDCTHQHEPDCAVQAALATGALPEARLQSYLLLRDEVALAEAQMPPHEQRARDRQQGRLYGQIQALKRQRR